jgi:hypothetical protein
VFIAEAVLQLALESGVGHMTRRWVGGGGTYSAFLAR